MFGLNEAMLSFLRRQVGLRTDVPDSVGSVHAKIGDVKSSVNAILNKTIIAQGTVIKGVQRGTYTVPSGSGRVHGANITISSVNTSKAFVLAQSEHNVIKSNWAINIGIRATLTSPTNLELRLLYEAPDATVNGAVVSWQVVEFY